MQNRANTKCSPFFLLKNLNNFNAREREITPNSPIHQTDFLILTKKKSMQNRDISKVSPQKILGSYAKQIQITVVAVLY